jgi:heme/copper-type cytochrome/quinol oxidase subunit 2
MAGKIVVLPEAEFKSWLDQEAVRQGVSGKTA